MYRSQPTGVSQHEQRPDRAGRGRTQYFWESIETALGDCARQSCRPSPATTHADAPADPVGVGRIHGDPSADGRVTNVSPSRAFREVVADCRSSCVTSIKEVLS